MHNVLILTTLQRCDVSHKLTTTRTPPHAHGYLCTSAAALGSIMRTYGYTDTLCNTSLHYMCHAILVHTILTIISLYATLTYNIRVSGTHYVHFTCYHTHTTHVVSFFLNHIWPRANAVQGVCHAA